MTKNTNKFNILVVEDDPGDFALVEDYLTEQITEPGIVRATSFRECSSILLKGDKVFDVILLDLSLPDKSGVVLVSEMLKITADCPLIVLTGFTDVDFSIHSISMGVSDYLLKDDLNSRSLYKSIVYCMERKKQLYELKESEKRYSNIFHLSPQAKWIYDEATLRFTQVNKAALELYGYSEKEFLSMTILDLKPEEDKSEFLKSVDGKENSKNTFKERFRHYKKTNEPIDVEIYSNPITFNDKHYRSVIAIDITEKLQFEYKLTSAIIKTQEDERYEIGAELHDNVCQILASCQLTLGMLKETFDLSGEVMFNKSCEYLNLATNEIRNLSHRLAPAFFNDTTLEKAFKRLLTDFNVENHYAISLNFDLLLKTTEISRDLRINLYRILQEQLRNILKYAKAPAIKVDVVKSRDGLKMQVSDNGIGFDTDKVKGGIGLSNMKRRAELFSGRLRIDSTPGLGCTVTADIPLK